MGQSVRWFDPTTCQQRPAKYIKAGQAELWCCMWPCCLSLEWLHKTQPPVTGAASHTSLPLELNELLRKLGAVP